MTDGFKAALGGLAAIPQWFIWRLEWNEAKKKYEKKPCPPSGGSANIDSADPNNWMTYGAACAALAQLLAIPLQGMTYALGFRMTADCGYWFLDIDNAAVDNAGTLSPIANAMLQRFPGAFVEWSSSGRGVHIIARGVPPKHRTKPPAELAASIKPTELEFYHEGRGIAFGLSRVAGGNADVSLDCTALCAEWFPPSVALEGELLDGPRPDWRGPADDEELIGRMLASRPSARAMFGNAMSVQDLWAGRVHDDRRSEADLALAGALAFWTGCDYERVTRLMWRSGLVRQKWTEHRTYLHMTVSKACAECDSVYQEPVRESVAPLYGLPSPGDVVATVESTGMTVTLAGQYITPEVTERMKVLRDMVSSAGTIEDMHNDVLPALRAAAIPGVMIESFVSQCAQRLKVLGAPMRLPELRSLIKPPAVKSDNEDEIPEWARHHCYVQIGDVFYDMRTGVEKSRMSFIAEYARYMPMTESGNRVDPSSRALQEWDMHVVQETAYRPDMPLFFEDGGLKFVNSYSPLSVPAVAAGYTQAGVDAINAFKAHLWCICGQRLEVYEQLLGWMAHNVQRPGVKVRWAPLIKGIEGDGKSIIAEVMRIAMGRRNVRITGNETLCNSGGWTEWATGRAVNFFEEIMIRGPERHRIYNAIKQYITNNTVSVNRRHRDSIDVRNTTNHCAFTNFTDGVPLSDTDRRWLIIYTPWGRMEEANAYCGLDVTARADAIFASLEREPAEWRLWLLSEPVPASFAPNKPAMHTAEKDHMRMSGRDEVETLVGDLIIEGGRGISEDVISTSCLSALLRVRALAESMDPPQTKALAFVLSRAGFSRWPRQIRWGNYPHRVWVRAGANFTADEQIKAALERTGA